MSFSFTTPLINDKIKEFDESLVNLLQSDISLIDVALKYIFNNKGKRIRPLLAILSAELFGSSNHRTIMGATLLEIFHTATLIHDDIVDQSNMRRGKPSANAVWKNKVSVLLGDYLISKGLIIATENKEMEFLKVTSRTGRFMSEGELLQIQKTKENQLDEATYFKIIKGKTASLTSASCEIGALSVNASQEECVKIAEFGELLGLAFQIRDDILDYQTDGSIIGKPVGNDLKEKKITLPLIYALKQTTKKEATQIIKIVKSGKIKKRDITKIINFSIDSGGIDYAQKRSEEFIDKAKIVLNDFNDCPAKTTLIDFADYIVYRDK